MSQEGTRDRRPPNRAADGADRRAAAAPTYSPTPPAAPDCSRSAHRPSPGEARHSLPRLQIVGWTFILILVFWANVFRDLAMPDLSDSVLALMGVSSGTYLGFKLQGKKTTPAAPTTAAPQATAPAPIAPGAA